MTRRSKYGNVKVEADGYKFDSKLERDRYEELKLLQKAGEIWQLEVHPSWTIEINQYKVCRIVMDFAFYIDGTNTYVVEDCKGVDNAVSRLKRKLLHAVHGITTVVIK